MNKKNIYISLLIISIIGLSIVQYQYFRIGLNLAGHQFNENMTRAVPDIQEGLSQRNELTYLLSSVVKNESSNFELSIDSLRDASSHFLNDYLVAKLNRHGIKAKFSYDLYSKDSVLYIQSKKQFESNDLLVYPIVLTGYLSDSSGNNLILQIEFDNVNRYFLSQLNGLTIPSLVFIAIIVLILIWVFRAFYLQKNLIVHTNEFINNLTHELKTPVFSMGVATKILEEKFKEDGADIIKMLRIQVERMNIQIDKVLELAIIEGKKDILDKKRMDLMPVLRRTADSFGNLVKLDGGIFRSEFQGKEYWVNGDEYHLENVMNSLLENAKKYSPDAVEIDLKARVEGKNVLIEVHDKGMGMPVDSQKKVFDKYFRITNGDRHDVKGYGLGLHYVKRIVTLHKGKIEVESTEKEGSTFRLILTLV